MSKIQKPYRCKKRVLRYKLSKGFDKKGQHCKMIVHEMGLYVTYRDYKLLVKNMQTQINQHKQKINFLQKELIKLRAERDLLIYEENKP